MKVFSGWDVGDTHRANVEMAVLEASEGRHMKLLIAAFGFGLLTIAFASPALADPCEARLPRAGETFSGTVRYVGDGDMVCLQVGGSSSGATWVEVRLADFNAPELNQAGGREARDTLRRLVMGRVATCRAGRRSYDRVVGLCTVGGRPIGDLMREAGLEEGGR